MRRLVVMLSTAVTVLGATCLVRAQPDLSGLEVVHNADELTAAILNAQPGDGILLKGGVYEGRWRIEAHGTADKPITLRSFPGEWARIVGTDAERIPDSDPGLIKGILHLDGRHWRVEHLEITGASDRMRWRRARAFDRQSEEWTKPTPTYGINAWGEGTTIRHTVIHDTGTAVGLWADAKGSEVYGNVFYNNGVNNLDHTIYTDNDGTAIKRIEDNILLNPSAHNLHAYDHDGSDVRGYDVISNISTGGGLLQPPADGVRAQRANFLFGLPSADVWGRMRDIHLVRNYLYTPAGRSGEDAELRWPQDLTGNEGLTLIGNAWQQERRRALLDDLNGWSDVYQEGNRIAARDQGGILDAVFVEPVDEHEQGRAHIVVFNGSGATSRRIAGLNQVLDYGQSYGIWNAFDPMGAPVYVGRYWGEYWRPRLPMTPDRLAPAQPVGITDPPPSTAPEFAVFIVRALPDENSTDWVSP